MLFQGTTGSLGIWSNNANRTKNFSPRFDSFRKIRQKMIFYVTNQTTMIMSKDNTSKTTTDTSNLKVPSGVKAVPKRGRGRPKKVGASSSSKPVNRGKKKELRKESKVEMHTEHYNTMAALKLLDHPALNDQKRAQLRTYILSSTHDLDTGISAKAVEYSRTQEHGLGRLYGKNSMQSLSHEIRHTISGAIDMDIDICNCHPTLLLQFCEKNRLSCPNIDIYVAERDESLLEDTVRLFKVPEKAAKNLYIAILNGGSLGGWMNEYCPLFDLQKAQDSYLFEFIEDLRKEIKHIQEEIWNYESFAQHKRTIFDGKSNTTDELLANGNPKATLLSIVLQIEEDNILHEIVRFQEHDAKREISTLMFDGCQVRRKSVADKISQGELEACSKWIKERTGFQVKLKEKPMVDRYDLQGCKPPIHLVCKNEADVASWLRKVHVGPQGEELFKFCDNSLYVFDKLTGMWNSDPKVIHNQLLREFRLELGDWIETINDWKKLFEMLQTQSCDPGFLKRIELSSLGKILFQDGYYDFFKRGFFKEFSPSMFFPFRIERPYPSQRNPQHIRYVKIALFRLPFANSRTGSFFTKCLARAAAGCIRDKRIYFNIGDRNAGKGLITDALAATLGPFVGTFNGAVFDLQQRGNDPALRFKEVFTKRFCRVLISNEMNMNKAIDGVFLKTVSSGGDAIDGRKLYGHDVTFIPHGTFFLNGNDRGKIEPSDGGTESRVVTTSFSNTFNKEVDSTILQAFSIEAYLNLFGHLEECNDERDGQDYLPDADIKERVREEWFMNALFHILEDEFQHTKVTIPDEVIKSTQVWAATETFLSQLEEDFEITGNLEHCVSNKTITEWAKQDRNMNISATRIGKEMKKLEQRGVISARKNHGQAFYQGITQRNSWFNSAE